MPSPGHCIDAVFYQVHYNLLYLGTVAFNRVVLGLETGLYGNIFRYELLEHLQRTLQHLVETEHFMCGALVVAKVEQLSGKCVSTLSGKQQSFHYLLFLFVQGGRGG